MKILDEIGTGMRLATAGARGGYSAAEVVEMINETIAAVAAKAPMRGEMVMACIGAAGGLLESRRDEVHAGPDDSQRIAAVMETALAAQAALLAEFRTLIERLPA